MRGSKFPLTFLLILCSLSHPIDPDTNLILKITTLMRKIVFMLLLSAVGFSLQAQTVFINEINYTATNTADRGFGVAGPQGTNLAGWSIEVFNSAGALIHTENLSGTIGTDPSGYNEIWYPVATLVGPADDINATLLDGSNTVQMFVSLGSSQVTALAGDANGAISTIINMAQTDPAKAVQLAGTGLVYIDFLWNAVQNSSPGAINPMQVFAALPVELMKFEGELNDEGIQLNWETGSEENNQAFIIERSQDGKNFEAIGRVEGNGTTSEQQFYEYLDESPEVGWNYYRLKQVDYDGAFTYSDMLSIYKTTEGSVSIFPNPLGKGQMLQIQTELKDVALTIMSVDGKVVKTQTINGNTQIDCSDLPAGVYIYNLTNGKDWTKSERLIITE